MRWFHVQTFTSWIGVSTREMFICEQTFSKDAVQIFINETENEILI